MPLRVVVEAQFAGTARQSPVVQLDVGVPGWNTAAASSGAKVLLESSPPSAALPPKPTVPFFWPLHPPDVDSSTVMIRSAVATTNGLRRRRDMSCVPPRHALGNIPSRATFLRGGGKCGEG